MCAGATAIPVCATRRDTMRNARVYKSCQSSATCGHKPAPRCILCKSDVEALAKPRAIRQAAAHATYWCIQHNCNTYTRNCTHNNKCDSAHRTPIIRFVWVLPSVYDKAKGMTTLHSAMCVRILFGVQRTTDLIQHTNSTAADMKHTQLLSLCIQGGYWNVQSCGPRYIWGTSILWLTPLMRFLSLVGYTRSPVFNLN